MKLILFRSAAVIAALQLVGNLSAADAKPAEKLPRIAPLEPAEALKNFKVQNGFSMQLLAAEPMVTDPVAMVYDENGLAYVVEMNDYPYTDAKAHEAWKDNTTDKPIGRIRVLEDTNGDGIFDKSYIFAENLSWPSGIICWKGGVYVTATPDIWYLKDTDGDHKADVREKVFSGFRKYNVQAVMNNPIWGLDNKIYIAGSGNGGSVVSDHHKDTKPVSISRNDFRVDPVTENFEPIAGGARFGNTFDNWGNRFICNIRNPAQQIVLDTRYFARNRFLPVANVIHDSATPGDQLPVYRISPVEPWREIRAQQWVAEDKKIPRSELTGGGVFTSASGITYYRGGAYPEIYRDNAFLGEVANNVIYRQKIVPDGVTFKASRADEKVEFVASTDIWFRPVNFVNAPDGTLHVLDMYREIIEHPWSIPDEIREQLDLESGRDRGRIYRLAPPNFKAPKPPKLGKASTAELVATLENPNSWWRETAQRLIFERQDKTAVAPLQNLLAKSTNALARLHALWTLDGLNALRAEDLMLALKDANPGIREHAVKLSEPFLEKSPELLGKILDMGTDENIRVRCQVALSIGGIEDNRVAQTLFFIGRKDPSDPWIRTAVLSANPDRAMQVLNLLFRDEELATSDAGREWMNRLAFVLGAQYKLNNIYEVLNRFYLVPYCQCFVQDAFWTGLGDGLRQAGKNLRTAFPNPDSFGAQKVEFVMQNAQMIALNEFEFPKKRIEAARLLSYENFDKSKDVLVKLLDARQPQEVQIAAVKSLAGFKNPEVGGILLQPWRNYTPEVREQVVTAIFARRERIDALLSSVESGAVPPAQLSATRKASLLANSDVKLRERAAKLFGQNVAGSRKEVLEKYKSVFALKGDRANGQKVFENNCMICHRLGDKGNDVGPNLETVRGWDVEKIMMNILDPNREVAPNFIAYDVELKDGSSLAGMIAAETANSITVKRAENSEETVLRQNIEKISSSGLSLMPEGLEAAIPEQDMADLIAFILAK